MWVGTSGGGVGVFDGAGWLLYTTANGLPGDNITALLDDGQDEVWVGTSNGLAAFDDSTWTSYTGADGLPPGEIQGLAADLLGQVWAAIDGAGVARWNGRNWQVFNRRNSGLADDQVLAVGVDAVGSAWFGTQGSGISLRGSFFAPIGLPAPTVTGFTPTSGPAGTIVTINGTNFDDRDPADNDVWLGQNLAKLLVVDATATTLEVEIPPFASSASFYIQTAGGAANSVPDIFTVLPQASSFTPLGGSAGQLVTIDGANLHDIANVYFTGSFTPAEIESQDTFMIEVRVPSDALSGPIWLFDADGNSFPTPDSFTVVQLEIIGAELNQGLAGYPLLGKKDTILNVFLASSSNQFPAYLDGVSLEVRDEDGTVVYSAVGPYLYNTQIAVANQINSTQNGTASFRIPGQFLEPPPLLSAGIDYTFDLSAWIFQAGGVTEVAQFQLTEAFGRPGAYWGTLLNGSLNLLVMEIEKSFDFADSFDAYLGGLDTLSRLYPIPHGIGNWEGLRIFFLPDRLNMDGYRCEPGATDSWVIGPNPFTVEMLAALEARRAFHNINPFGGAFAIMGFIHDDCTAASGDSGIALTWPIGSSITTLDPGQTGVTAAHELAHTFGRVPFWAPNRCQPTSGCIGGGGLFDGHSIFQTAAPAGARAYNIFNSQNISANNPSVMSNDAPGQTDGNVLFEIGDYTCLNQWPGLCTGAVFGSQPVARAARQTDQNVVLTGLLHGDGSAEIADSFLAPAGVQQTPPMGDEYYLVFLQDSQVLSSEPFIPAVGHVHHEGNQVGDTTMFSLVRPMPAGTNRIEIRREEDFLTSIAPGDAAPDITVISPNGGQSYGQNETVLIEWQAADPDNDPLQYAIFYSSDNGDTYTVVTTGLTETQYQWDTAWAAGSDQAMIRIMATDGLHTGSDDSDAPFNIAGHAPMAAIVSPDDGAVFSQFDLIVLRGLALDLEEGLLNDETLVWQSDRDGSLGHGERLELTGLSLGMHTITLQATDGEGHMVSDQVIIEVQRDFDRDGLLDSYEALYDSLNFWDSADATADGDEDNLVNLDEAFFNCHPEQADSDGDGINDGAEVSAGSDCDDADSVPEPPELALGPTELTFTAQMNAAPPHPQGIEIANLGGGTLNWSAQVNVPWLTITPQNGMGPAVIEVAADPTALTVGDHTGQVSISDSSRTIESTQIVTVSLSVVSASPLPEKQRLYLPMIAK